MVWTDDIAKAMGVSQSLVDSVAEKIGVMGIKHSDGSYSINDSNVPKLKLAILMQEIYPDFKHLFETENSEENLLKTLQSENETLQSQISELQAKLDLIEKEKIETAEVVARIAERFF